MFDKISTYVPQMAKAIAGAVVAPVAMFLLHNGLVLSTDQQTALQTIITGLIVGAVVWLVPNKKV